MNMMENLDLNIDSIEVSTKSKKSIFRLFHLARAGDVSTYCGDLLQKRAGGSCGHMPLKEKYEHQDERIEENAKPTWNQP
jgi:hypothetical protein